MDDGLGEDATQAIPVTPASLPPEPGTTPGWVLADRYRVLDRLGSGGMAEVFRAHDDQLDRDVAVKVFRTPVDEPGNATAVERREIELRALAQLSHPNLITLYDANIVGAHPAFLVTELVIGPNLADRLTDGPLPEELARTVGEQIADALAYVHARGMVHRDVKPANILLGTDGATPETATIRARLSDFGIVRVLDDARMTAAEFTLGTAFYIAPEQARGGDVDAAADVYSLGLVLIEMLSGVRSFDGPMHEAMAARLTHAPEIPAGLPQPWPGLLTAMTQLDPTARPSAAEVAQSLRTSTIPALAVASALPLPLVAVPGGSPLPPHLPAGLVTSAPGPIDPLPTRRRRGLGMGVAALAFLAVIATAAILMFHGSSAPSTPGGGASDAPASTSSQSSATSASKSNNDAAVPVTAGGSATSSAPSSAATSGPPSTSKAPSTKASSSPVRSSTSAKPTSSTAKPSPSKTKTTTSAPPSSSATSSSAPASGSVPASAGAALSSGPA